MSREAIRSMRQLHGELREAISDNIREPSEANAARCRAAADAYREAVARDRAATEHNHRVWAEAEAMLCPPAPPPAAPAPRDKSVWLYGLCLAAGLGAVLNVLNVLRCLGVLK